MKFKTRKKEKLTSHIIECKERLSNLVEGVDYMHCKICNFHGKSLKLHFTLIHPEVNLKEYQDKYGALICKNSSKKYSEENGSRESFITKAKREGRSLDEYWKKVSDGVKNAILNNPEEIKRRSEAMIALNEKQQSDPKFQELVRQTAIKTSARKDIQENRTKRLKKWRDEHPDEFNEKCISKMIGSFQSKPEKKLFDFLNSLNVFNFKRNQFVNSLLITNKSHNKQVDIADKDNRIYIEFDGVLHFEPKFGQETLDGVRKRDSELDQHILKHNWLLIRVSYDQYVDKDKIEKSYFKQECLDKIIEILNNKQPGIYKIGAAYG